MKEFYSNGKLLLTAEYLVLDGALALAIPTIFGQSLTVNPIDASKLIWHSFDENSKLWFSVEIDLDSENLPIIITNDEKTANRLNQILQKAKQINPNFLNSKQGYNVKTHLDFPKNWGLGTSSTLINNIADWAQIDAYELLALTFEGSGYDIACAKSKKALTYELDKQDRIIQPVEFNPQFKNQLYFVFLNKKQNSREGIAHYKSGLFDKAKAVSVISDLTQQLISCQTLRNYEAIVTKHEAIISTILNLKPVKESLFSDFKGSIKSLGAWGGDFVMVSSNEDPTHYFRSKGFPTIMPFSDMIIK